MADANHSKTWNCQCDLSSDALVPSLNRHQKTAPHWAPGEAGWLCHSVAASLWRVWSLCWCDSRHHNSAPWSPNLSTPLLLIPPAPPQLGEEPACENKTLETIRREWLVSLGSFRSKIKDARISLFMFNYILYYFFRLCLHQRTQQFNYVCFRSFMSLSIFSLAFPFEFLIISIWFPLNKLNL